MENKTTLRRSDLPWEPKMRLAHLGVESLYGDDDDARTREEFTITDTGGEYIIISRHRVVHIAHPLLEALIAFHREGHPESTVVLAEE
jgi:hypothetical protein